MGIMLIGNPLNLCFWVHGSNLGRTPIISNDTFCDSSQTSKQEAWQCLY